MTDKTKPEIDFYDGPEPTELVIRDIEIGSGAEAQPGSTVDVHYLGVDFESGEEFDSSWSGSKAYTFQVGGGNVIPGWDQGLIGVKAGSRVQLDIPAALAYGATTTDGSPAGDLRFVIDVLAVTPAPAPSAS